MANARRRSRSARVLALSVACVAPVLCAQDQSTVEPRYYEFYGELEQTPVQLGGEGLPELFSACTELMSTSGVEPVGELAVEGRRFVRTDGYFDRQEACGFVVLNARPPGPSHFPETPLMTGSVPNSSEGSGVNCPTCWAINWSTEMPPLLMSLPVVLVTGIPVRKLAVLA